MKVYDTTSAIPLTVLGDNGIVRYLAPDSMAWKRITVAEYSKYPKDQVGLVWEGTGRAWLLGGDKARSDAQAALKQVAVLGYPKGSVIYNADGDFNISKPEWSGKCIEYVKTWYSEISAGGYEPGVYSHRDVLVQCATLGYDHLWQCMSTAYGFTPYSNSVDYEKATLIQRERVTLSGMYDADRNDAQIGWNQNMSTAFDAIKDVTLALPKEWTFLKRQDDGGVRLADVFGWMVGKLYSINIDSKALAAEIVRALPSGTQVTVEQMEEAVRNVFREGVDG